MKKKIIIPIVVVMLILIIGLVGFVLWNNRIVSTITLDINPSFEINLTRNELVRSVVALNDDAKDIISSDLKGKSLDDTLESITNNLANNYDNNNIDVILYTEGKIQDEDVASKVEFIFGKKDIHAEVIVIEKITKEDKKLAKEYNISPAKAFYIKSITDNNDNISIEDIANKSVTELKETKITGKYCDKGYTLEGDWCIKEIDRVKASGGEVCPKEYYEYNGKCYGETASIESENYICRDGFKLDNNKCVKEITENAIPTKYSCTKGTSKTKAEAGLTFATAGDANDIVCDDQLAEETRREGYSSIITFD